MKAVILNVSFYSVPAQIPPAGMSRTILIYVAAILFSATVSGQTGPAFEKGNHLNHLAHESSPYLLQHADNPVDWYPWEEEAFRKAEELDRPIFLSIGYSTCHWCHVMEHESFEDKDVAQLLNRDFIAIKVDREERPEIDHLYMSVCQAMTGNGGWPLTIVMTPDKKPFFAGTYFPKQGRYGRPGLMELLPTIVDAWKNKREDLLQSADRVQDFLKEANAKTLGPPLSDTILKTTFEQFKNRFDNQYGGFGSQPKFPSPHNLIFLLRYYNMTHEKSARSMVETTLESMRLGGIFDQLGYGFHRYSTDQQWLVPHFEKMLYDQAMLTLAYTEAYQVTRKEFYRQTAEEILTYVLRDMSRPEGGFYSAEDADSEGKEGKFYLLKMAEIREILTPPEVEIITQVFHLQEEGNFSNGTSDSAGENILHLTGNTKDWITPASVIPAPDREVFNTAVQRLFQARETRIHPYKDDKILTDWNGLMIAALARASHVFKSDVYRQAAEKSAHFILKSLRREDGRLQKRFRNGQAGLDAHLDDYAFVIWGLLNLYETTFNLDYLQRARELTDLMVEDFWDEEHSGFFLGGDQSEKLLVRTKSGYDGAYPSGNSVATFDLLRLARITGDQTLNAMAEKSFRLYSNEIQRAPSGFTFLLTAYLFIEDDPKEIVIVGNGKDNTMKSALEAIRNLYSPNKIILFKDTNGDTDLLTRLAPWTEYQTSIDAQPTFYVCRNFACNQPTTDLDQAIHYIQE